MYLATHPQMHLYTRNAYSVTYVHTSTYTCSCVRVHERADFTVVGRQFWSVHVDFACFHWLVVYFIFLAVKKNFAQGHLYEH